MDKMWASGILPVKNLKQHLPGFKSFGPWTEKSIAPMINMKQPDAFIPIKYALSKTLPQNQNLMDRAQGKYFQETS